MVVLFSLIIVGGALSVLLALRLGRPASKAPDMRLESSSSSESVTPLIVAIADIRSEVDRIAALQTANGVRELVIEVLADLRAEESDEDLLRRFVIRLEALVSDMDTRLSLLDLRVSSVVKQVENTSDEVAGLRLFREEALYRDPLP